MNTFVYLLVGVLDDCLLPAAPEHARFGHRFEEKAAFDFIPPIERVTLNVGGHIFETTAGVLCRDRYSLLAAICKTSPPIKKDEQGTFFFDRDW